MNPPAIEFSILLPALLAGLILTATHVPLGMQVLQRGIVFIDLAIAQIAGLGVIFADWLGFAAHGWAVQLVALSAAFAGAVLLTWTEKHWPAVQEAVIGVSFIVAASAATLLLASNPRGSEHLKELLVGQILWVSPGTLALVAMAYALVLAVWFGLQRRIGRIGFYLVFACTVTISVQLVGLYLVFATLIVPALAARRFARRALAAGYAVSLAGYALGLAAAALWDLPPGPAVVCTMVAVAIAVGIPGLYPAARP
jgi:zinc/manganese transport system permease protein